MRGGIFEAIVRKSTIARRGIFTRSSHRRGGPRRIIVSEPVFWIAVPVALILGAMLWNEHRKTNQPSQEHTNAETLSGAKKGPTFEIDLYLYRGEHP